MRRSMLTILLGLFLFSLCPSKSDARTSQHFPYPIKPVWSTCIRLLRVDFGFKIIEKDSKSGYILFDYNEDGAKSSASVEIINQEKNGLII